MEKDNSFSKMQQAFAENIKEMTNLSLSTMIPFAEKMSENMAAALSGFQLQDSNCCRPKNECPPHCIASITRSAMAGERIIVPFTVKNTCGTAKTYRVGIRDLKDADGNLAPGQPTLNKEILTLQPGQAQRVLMTIDLIKYQNGKEYSAEIVLLEKTINQNVCFTLIVEDHYSTIVKPQSENKYNRRWHGWESHYYCDKQRNMFTHADGTP